MTEHLETRIRPIIVVKLRNSLLLRAFYALIEQTLLFNLQRPE